MMNGHDREVLAEIRQETLQTLSRVLGVPGMPRRRAVVLDFPRHKNAGDHLIWHGTMRYLDRLGIRVAYSCDLDRFDRAVFDRARDGAVVLFHGGGNLGDLYPIHQEFRERTVPLCRGSKVVILSQSVWFDDPANAARANRALADHDDLTLLVRDPESVERARRQLPDVRIVPCPDMAFGADPLRTIGAPDHDYVVLNRRDKESRGEALPELEEATDPVDWFVSMSPRDARAYTVSMLPARIRNRMPPAVKPAFNRFAHLGNNAMSRVNVRSAVRILSHGRVALVDRLHAHVLAVLLGMPHVAVDNTYGKIGAVVHAYSGRFSTAHLAASSEDQARIARDLLAALDR